MLVTQGMVTPVIATGCHFENKTVREEKIKLTDYLGGIRAASTADELEIALKAPYKHAFYGRTWSMICKARIECGNTICREHPLGKFVPYMAGRKLSVCGESYGVSRGGNSTGARYVWCGVEAFVKGTLKNHGFTTRAAHRIWDCWSDYPHRCLKVIETALSGGYPDPVMDTLIFGYTGQNPVKITEAENNAEPYWKRATLKCKCSGTLFDWGCGFSEDFTFINWHCNKCPAVYTEYVTPDRFKQIRNPKTHIGAIIE